MRTVYRAENIIDANLVKGTLAQSGIDAFVAGEYLTGGAGQLPAFGLVSVMVAEEDEPAAAPIVAAIDAALRSAQPADLTEPEIGWFPA